MSFTTSIIEFLKTGALGPLTVGLPKEKVEELLGEPDGRTTKAKPLILKYNSMQLSFLKHPNLHQLVLNSIHLYFDEQFALPDSLVIDGWIPDGEKSSSGLITEAKNRGVQLILDPKHTFFEQIGYLSGAGTSVIFSVNQQKTKLISMHYALT